MNRERPSNERSNGKAARCDRGRIFVVSGPSGSGKTTIVERVKGLSDVYYSISATSREPRRGERDGGDYYFLSRQEFEEKIAAGGFAEYAEVAGNLYGTPKRPLLEALEEGRRVLVDIDVRGAMQIRAAFPSATLIFIKPPDLETLEERLRSRATDSEEAIRRRLEMAERELEYEPRYDYTVVNDDLERSVERVRQIILET